MSRRPLSGAPRPTEVGGGAPMIREFSLDDPRASDVFDIPLGAVMTKLGDEPRFGSTYIFVGWSQSTLGKVAVFVQDETGKPTGRPPWTYTVASEHKMLEKFPEVERYRRKDRRVSTTVTEGL